MLSKFDRRLRRGGGPDDERGAVLLIVAITLVVLFGMLVLTVDLGLLVARKRVTVQSADAAALAAALSCAGRDGTAEASAQAFEYVTQNGSDGILDGYPRYTPSCDAFSGTVTVRVRITQELLFAPALGFGTESDVVAEATARWGGAGAGENISPLMVNMDRLGNCQIPPPPEEAELWTDRECTFWSNNSPTADEDPDLSNAEWGTLDLERWDVEANAQCSNSTPPEFETWMFEGYWDPLPVNYPDPTYVCRGRGNFGNALKRQLDQAIEMEIQLYFPVNNPQGQVDKDGNLCPPGSTTGCSPHKYDIIGFAIMKITGAHRGNQPESAICKERIFGDPNAKTDPNALCLITRWVGFSHEGLNPAEALNFGVVPVQLIE